MDGNRVDCYANLISKYQNACKKVSSLFSKIAELRETNSQTDEYKKTLNELIEAKKEVEEYSAVIEFMKRDLINSQGELSILERDDIKRERIDRDDDDYEEINDDKVYDRIYEQHDYFYDKRRRYEE